MGAVRVRKSFFDKWLYILFIWFCTIFCHAQEAKKDSLPDYQILYESGMKKMDSSRYKEAIPLLKKATKKKPDYWEAWNKMAYSQMQLKE